MKVFQNAVDVVKDFTRQGKIALGAHQRKPDAQFDRLSDGTLDHNVDLSDFPADKRPAAEQVIQRSVEEIEYAEEMLANARAEGNETDEEHWEGKLAEARDTFTEVKWQLETRDIDLQTINNVVQFGFLAPVAEGMRTGKIDQRIEDASGKLDEATGATTASGGDTGGDGVSAAGDDDPSAAFENVMDDVDAAVERFEKDPRAFFDELSEMTSEERGHALTAIQNQIQQNNRLMSMLTNFQQAMHDTNKAVIANLRV